MAKTLVSFLNYFCNPPEYLCPLERLVTVAFPHPVSRLPDGRDDPSMHLERVVYTFLFNLVWDDVPEVLEHLEHTFRNKIMVRNISKIFLPNAFGFIHSVPWR